MGERFIVESFSEALLDVLLEISCSLSGAEHRVSGLQPGLCFNETGLLQQYAKGVHRHADAANVDTAKKHDHAHRSMIAQARYGGGGDDSYNVVGCTEGVLA